MLTSDARNAAMGGREKAAGMIARCQGWRTRVKGMPGLRNRIKTLASARLKERRRDCPTFGRERFMPAEEAVNKSPRLLDCDCASFEMAASRPPQDEDLFLTPSTNLPHPEERPRGASRRTHSVHAALLESCLQIPHYTLGNQHP